MMNSKSALGKGLSALIGDSAASDGNINFIDLNNIIANPNQPRRVFDEVALLELADSIRQNGVLQPILVTQIEDKYIIIAGERRFRAAKLAGLENIPAIIKDVDSKKALELAILENIQREDLSPIEEAESYDKLLKQFNYTHEDLSKLLNKSRSHISNVLRILNLPDEVKFLINDNKISLGHAKILVSSDDPISVANRIVSENLSVRSTEKLLNEHRKTPPQKRHKRLIREGAHVHFQKETDLLEIEKMLSDFLTMKVEINDTLEGGEMIIKFESLSQLDFLITKLGN
jgi:ParB family chromosome partitioning protein